ncbi:MAG TPA: ACT domain-containing protein, partial [Dehalococcoidia bacterium]|nr:ACT domain-containing protein [Dehalococcoidia bacterium]
TGRDKTSLAFTFAVEDRPGLLVSVLSGFASHDINLSKIESRPGGERLGVYVFLADIDGHRKDLVLSQVLSEVSGLCSFFRVMGSYPRCPLPA